MGVRGSTADGVAFESLLSDILARFVSVEPENVHEEIARALERVREFCEADRFGLFRSGADGIYPLHMREAGSADGLAAPPSGETDRRAMYPWLAAKMARGEGIVVWKGDLPPEANGDRATMEELGVESILAVPVQVHGETRFVLGGLYTDERREWPCELLSRLRLLGEVFVSALTRCTAQAERRRSEARLAEVQRLAHVGSWIWDLETDEVWGSDEAYRLFGLTVGEAVTGESWLNELVHPEDREAAAAAWARALDEPEEGYRAEFRVTWADGSEHILDDRGEVICDEWSGKPTRIVGTTRDVTEQRGREAELQRLRAELAHLDRVGTLGAMAASLAHEVNQPLAAIRGDAQAALRLIEDGRMDLDAVKEVLDDIVAENRRASDVIGRMRAMLRKDEPEREAIAVNEAIELALGVMRSETVTRGVQVSTELAAGLPSVLADRVQLQQVVLNLLLNAAEAMDDLPRDEREIVVRTERGDPDAVHVSVSDVGVGLGEDELESVFEPFYTTKSRGLGVGLAICRDIATAHGGRVWASRNADRGATFTISLPVFQEDP